MGEAPSSAQKPWASKFLRQTAGVFTSPPLRARLALLLLIAIALLYAPAINFEFLNYDDDMHVYENGLVNDFSPAKLARIWSRPIQGLYIPLTYSLWGILGKLASWLHPANNPTVLDPAVFHAANIVLHAGAALVVFAILRLLLKRDWPAAGGALLFALHPVQVAPVAWVSEMKGVLSGLLGLLAIWQYLRYAEPLSETKRRRKRRYVAATCLFIAAMLAKPNVACIPLIAAVLALLLLGRDWRKAGLELIPWLLLTIPIAFITKGIQPSERLEFLPNLWQRFLVAGDAITFYHTKLLWPFRLAPDYGRDPEEVLASGWIYLTGLLPYAVATLLLWQLRHRWLVAGALVFIAALLPVLGFIPFAFQEISTVANRYLYLAMLAPALLFGHLLCRYPGRRMAAIASVLLVLLAIRSSDRLSYWHDSLTFNRRAVEINPESTLCNNNLGIAYKERGQTVEATKAFQQAIKYASGFTPAYANLANLYAETGFPEKSRELYLKALEFNPFYPKAYLQLGLMAAKAGHPLEAFNYYQKALTIDPLYAPTYGYLGLFYTQLSQYDKAIASYQQAITLDPYMAEAYVNLGQLYELTDHRPEAVAAYRQGIWLRPERPEALNNLGKMLLDDNNPNDALPLLRQAAELSSDHPAPASNLGLALLRLGHVQEATTWFRKALSIAPDYPAARNGLTEAEALEKDILTPAAGVNDSDELSGP